MDLQLQSRDDQELVKVTCLIYRSLQLKFFINCNFCVVAKCYSAALPLTIFVLFTKTSNNQEGTRKFQLLLKSTAGAKGLTTPTGAILMQKNLKDV